MTTVAFTMEDERVVSVTVENHSGFADAGEDIVCAAISNSINLIETALNTVMGLCATVKVDQELARAFLRLPGGLSEEIDNTCQILMAALMVNLVELQEQYPDHINVLEVYKDL